MPSNPVTKWIIVGAIVLGLFGALVGTHQWGTVIALIVGFGAGFYARGRR